MDLGDQQRRKRVDARDADAVQTSRDLVAALVELTAGVEHRQHHFERRFALLLVVVGRNASAVVLDADVHGGTLAHRFETFKDLNVRRGVFFFLFFNVF